MIWTVCVHMCDVHLCVCVCTSTLHWSPGVLSAVKACLIIVGARPTASQLVACIVTSLSYQP